MTKPIIFFDESHNTGAHLLDANQPIFTLASVDYNSDECSELLLLVLSHQASEGKFSSLQGSEAGRRKILDFIRSPIHSEKRVKTMIVHKHFNVVTQLVDIIEATLMRWDGIDIYKNSGNIVLANLHWYSAPHFFGEQKFNDFLTNFVEMVRNKSSESKRKFFDVANVLYHNCTDGKYKSMLAPYIYAERFIDDILNGIDNKYHIDPAIFSFFCHLTEWGKQLDEAPIVIYDESKPIKASQPIFMKMMDSSIPPKEVGYGQRKFMVPLNIKELHSGNSKQYAALQVADLMAGATRYYYSAFFRNTNDQFADKLKDAGIERFLFGAIAPQDLEHLTSDDLITSDNDINPADYMTKFCS
ncbi:hypothetical protein BJL95_11105 [Methylomonas sp. LWB]|uniref:DUF3800 domain-containing protein n=1 Tax=Methylomonas sp. LWB TaxID=1905845 RepID=UPI0008D8FC12|nr:DUF3800 domain-containing protein [Methylomonas sp. LWB]OHX36315.1 hypothetical protein BJL95_11105 [Methylomonas sp. LWB]